MTSTSLALQLWEVQVVLEPYAFLCSQMSSLIFRLSRQIPGSCNLAHCIDQRLQVLPQVDLKLLHGESGEERWLASGFAHHLSHG